MLREISAPGLTALRLAEGKIEQVLPQAAFDALPAGGAPVIDLDGSTVMSALSGSLSATACRKNCAPHDHVTPVPSWVQAG